MKFLAVLLIAVPSVASAAFFLRSESSYPVLGDEVSFRVDAARDLSIEQVMNDAGAWVSQRDRRFRPAEGPVNLWAKFDIPVASAARHVFVVSGPWESVEYFIVRDDRVVDRQKTGSRVPWAGRTTLVTMASPMIAAFAAVEIPPDARVTVLARLAHSQRLVRAPQLLFSLWDAEQVRAGERQDRLFQGIYFGMLLVLIVYNLALYALNANESSYLYYVISLLGNAGLMGALFGLTFEYLWPNHPSWDLFCLLLSMPLAVWAFCQFARKYLDTPRHFPKTDTLLMWEARACLLVLPVLLLPPMIDQPISIYLLLVAITLVATAAIVLLFGVSVVALMKHLAFARLFFAAILCAGVGALISIGPLFRLLPAEDWILHAGQIGTVLTGIILSIGLGFRIRALREELSERQLADAHRERAIERERREFTEQQSHALEIKIQERTAELRIAQSKSDALLASILPQSIVDELKATGKTEPRRYEETSILFTDFSGFTQAVSTIPPARLVRELDELFRGFDEIVVAHGLEKIKTIGDAYMAAAGVPLPAGDHAIRCVRAALAITRFIQVRNETAAMKWDLRVGVHSGAVVAGIVGKDKFAYDVWGDTVNIASRLETAGDINKVNISAYTYELVRAWFDCEYRGKLTAKGKGEIDMYFVLRETRGVEANPASS